MKDLIARYDAGLRARIVEIVARRPGRLARPRTCWSSAPEGRPPILYPDDDVERGRELPRARAGDGGARPPPRLHPRRPAGARRCAARHDERAGDLGARGRRHALEPLHVHQAAEPRSSPRRSDPSSAGPDADRLGVRARRRHRPPATRVQWPRRAITSSATPGERRVGSRGPRRHASRHGLAHRQVARHVRADGPVHRARRVRRRSAESSA